MSQSETNYELFGQRVAALLGAPDNWDGAADYLDAIAGEAARSGLKPFTGANQAEYRALADKVGVYYEVTEEDDDDVSI